MRLTEFNDLPADAARQALLGCCAAPRWASRVVAGRPYRSVAELRAAAAAELTDADVADGLAGHPRIGERTADPRSAREQGGVAGASAEVLAALAAGNQEYEKRFGQVYLVCASGRSAEDLLDTLRRRLDNDPDTERAVTREELVKITQLRLDQLFAETPEPAVSEGAH